MAGGRPTGYNETICARAQEYLDNCIDVRTEDGLTVNLPSVGGLLAIST